MTEELAVALGAGILAAVNPCGFALLPAYLSLLIIDQNGADRRPALRRAVVSTAAMTVGFVAVFAVFGLVIAPLAAGVQRYLPAVTVVAGVALVIAGCWLLAGRSLPTFGWSPQGRRPSRRVGAMVGFGVTYALASLTCTIGPFLAIVVAASARDRPRKACCFSWRTGSGWGCWWAPQPSRWLWPAPHCWTGCAASAGWFPGWRERCWFWSAATWPTTGGGAGVPGGSDADDPVIMAAADVQRELATAVQSLGIGGWLLVGAALTLIELATNGIRWRSAVR